MMSRRIWVAGGTAALAATGAHLYRAAPGFWQQYRNEMKRPVEEPPMTPDPEKWPDKGLHAAWLGHSTVLMKVDGFTILTDPVFSVRAGVHMGPMTLGVKRLVAPALDVKRLPEIDLVLLSHAHMDHFDLPSLRRVESGKTAVVTAPRTSDLLRVGQYASVTEIGWGQEHRVGPLTARGLEVNHWGARVRTDTYRGYNGYLLRVGRYRIVFAGDTADTERFRGITKNADLIVMPIGAYNPWIRFHCTPEQAWRMGQDARAEFFFPVHHSTFQLSREPLREPLERLHAAAGREDERIVMHQIGEEFHLS